MTNQVIIHPTPSELSLLQKQAKQAGMTTEQFVNHLLRMAITETDTQLRTIVYS